MMQRIATAFEGGAAMPKESTVYELLKDQHHVGAENAITGRELSRILNVDRRTVTQWIRDERLSGKPICASAMGENAGYYLPATPGEFENYCHRMDGRIAEYLDVYKALMCSSPV